MSLEEIKAYAEARYDEAEKRLDEAVKNGKLSDMQFWRGYREAAERIMEAVS